MNYFISLFIALTLFTTHAFAWEITADFEGGTIGEKAESPNYDAFGIAAGNSKYASSPAISGSQSASVFAKQGSTGFGVWGGGFDFPQDLKEGDTIWARLNVYYPSGWTFDCSPCTQGVKFMRIHTKSSGGSNEGYHSNLIKGGSTGGLITADSEVNGSPFWINNNNGAGLRNLGTPAGRNQWITYEMQIKFHSKTNQGIYRIWQDGNLIFEDLKTATLRSSTSSADLIYIYSYWNNGAPKDQTSYIDDIVITNEIPGRTDSNGNSYIGVGPSIYISPPNPPSPITAN